MCPSIACSSIAQHSEGASKSCHRVDAERQRVFIPVVHDAGVRLGVDQQKSGSSQMSVVWRLPAPAC